MGHYKRIVRKKEKKKELLIDPTSQIQDWLAENSGRLMLTAAGVFLAGVIAYGVVYYQKVRRSDAQIALYEAGSGDKSISELNAFIENKGPVKVINQARLILAALYVEEKKYDEAITKYRQTADATKTGELINEISLAGEASALSLSGKEDEAVDVFSKLAESEGSYPSNEALLSMAYASASAGGKDRAVETLKRLQSESSYALPSEQIEATIKRIERGDLEKAMAGLEKVSASEPVPSGPERIGEENIHQSK
ncbi:hypothetical protein MNBD_NITROSPINAE03-835 [hydrothermal vent metagenome]|uniref:Tetratricopeptide repeat-like domain-containing protein n=1 Tax=hydrothermal vent metagenome TaxID=652676 RepID=A0A3B1C9R4_9ZZZZ